MALRDLRLNQTSIIVVVFFAGYLAADTLPTLKHAGKNPCFHGNLGADEASVNDKNCKCFVYSGSALIFSS